MSILGTILKVSAIIVGGSLMVDGSVGLVNDAKESIAAKKAKRQQEESEETEE